VKLRAATVLPALAVAAATGLATATALSAAGDGAGTEPVGAPEPVEVAAIDEPLLVPDVRKQPYVVAKGILDDAGFAWKVAGAVDGFAANTVVKQDPAPGTLVEDTGAPLVTLRLKANRAYDERGVAKNTSSYRGTQVVVWSEDAGGDAAGTEIGEIPPAEPVAPAPAEPAAEPAAEPVEEPAADAPADAPAAAPAAPEGREPDFVVPGAPPEPPGELPLTERAERLAKKVAAASEATPELVDHWLYQHEWIVQGALFGWSDGEEALVALIEIDEGMQARWGIGAKSADVARDALAEVRRRSS
jgi:hypothetical protein